MISLGITKLAAICWMVLLITTTTTRITTNTLAFTIRPVLTKPSTLIPLSMIDRNTADMIDQEYYRQHHKEEYHQQWMAQHQQQVKPTSRTNDNDDNVVAVGVLDTYNNDNSDNDMLLNRRQLLRDEKLARTNPQQYCMDRCIATGYCDVYED
jgi:hypothetical protein